MRSIPRNPPERRGRIAPLATDQLFLQRRDPFLQLFNDLLELSNPSKERTSSSLNMAVPSMLSSKVQVAVLTKLDLPYLSRFLEPVTRKPPRTTILRNSPHDVFRRPVRDLGIYLQGDRNLGPHQAREMGDHLISDLAGVPPYPCGVQRHGSVKPPRLLLRRWGRLSPIWTRTRLWFLTHGS